MTRHEGDAPSGILRVGAEPVPGYMLLSRLGKGGFGEVWRAHAPGGFEVALKFVPMDEPAGAVESRALDVIRHIRHPNLLTPFGSWRVGELLVIGMDLADGSLWDTLRNYQSQNRIGIPGG